MNYEVTIENTQENYLCSEGQHLLQGMERLGRHGIPVGCRGGGCGVCKVLVTSGSYHTKKMSRSCISQEDESKQVVLACRCYPTSDLKLVAIDTMEQVLAAGQTLE